MKYLVQTRQLDWYDVYFSVEADSEEEAKELVLDLDPKAQFNWDDFIGSEKVEIVKVEIANEN